MVSVCAMGVVCVDVQACLVLIFSAFTQVSSGELRENRHLRRTKNGRAWLLLISSTETNCESIASTCSHSPSFFFLNTLHRYATHSCR